MALFTNPPELTCGNPERPKNSRSFGGVQGSKQIFSYGGNVFTGNQATKDTGGSSTDYPIVFKRVAGVWSKPDATNWQGVVDASAANWQFPSQCVSGGKIHFVTGSPNPYFLFYWTFDLATETYAAATSSPYFVSPGVSSEAVGFPRVAGLSDGRLFIAWSGPVSNKAGKFAYVTAGVFTAGTVFEPAAAGLTATVIGLVIDSSDAAHILYKKAVGATVSLWHVTVTSGGAVGTPTQIESSGGNYDCGPGCIFNGKVTFTVIKAFDANVYLLESDPVVISWTKKTIAARTNDTGGGVFPVPVIFSATQLYIHWWEQDSTLYPASTAKSFYSIYDGSTFTAKAVGWDAGANQYQGATMPIVPDGDIDMSALTAEYSSSGKMQLLGWSEFNDSFQESELYLEVPLGGQTGYENTGRLSWH